MNGVATEVDYLHLVPERGLPAIERRAFKAVIVVGQTVDAEWQKQVSEWLVEAGCLYMMAWGPDSSSWDDSVDWANLAAWNFEDIPDDQFVMTTWHDDEPLAETFWFSEHAAHHPTVELARTLVIEVGPEAHRNEMLAAYAQAQKKHE